MQVQVEMYPDRLVIRNPGGLYGPVEVGSLGTTTVTSSRNRALLKILEDTPFGDGHMVCENRGTGIARMLVALGEAGMEPPRFADDISLFTVEFPNHTLLDEATLSWLGSLETTPLTRAQMTALALMRSGVVVNNSSYRASTGVQDSRAATRELRELVDAGVIEQSGSRGTATYQLAAAHRLRGTEASQTEAFSYPLNDNEAKILGLLDGVELSRAEIIERSGLTKDQVLYALQSLRKKQRVTLKGQQRSRSALWTASR
jgi:ATP-dependent DNA helicase RecG